MIPPPLDRLSIRRLLTLVCLGVVGSAAPVAAQLQQPEDLVPGDTIMATPIGRYPAGALHRWVLGNGHRELWELPVPAPVLDFETFAGGLVPIRVGGGQQTRSLRLQGADGVVYNFRSIDKDASRTLDPELRTSLAADILQDQIASLFPLSSMVVAPLLDAAGVFHPGPELVVLPGPEALGEEYRSFAGLLGWLEVRPDEGLDDTAGFEGSRRVISTPRLFERIEEGSDDLVDQEEFLRARLLDFLVGDWDRHPDQWRWAGFDGSVGERDVNLFRPIPRDRDWALARLDGAFTTFSQIPWPQYMGFANEVPSAFRISWNGRGLDRRYLNALSRDDVQRVAREVQAALTDEVLEDAVGRLPENYRAEVGERLLASLRTRRDGLARLADEFYRLLAGWPDIDLTDEDESVDVERLSDGRLRVAAFDLRDGERRALPWYERTFEPEFTREVRLYLRGGDDDIRVFGDGPSTIRVRIVGGGGDDRIEDLTGRGKVDVYDHRGDNEVTGSAGTHYDPSDYDAPEDAEAEQHGARSRDWGRRWIPLPQLSYSPEEGLIVGGGAQRTGYGFRSFPWANRLDATAAIALGTGRALLSVRYDFGLFGGALRNRSGVTVSQAGARRFYGFGNGTGEIDDDLADAGRTEVEIASLFTLQPADGVGVSFGPVFEAIRPFDDDPALIVDLAPYGFDEFEQVAVTARLAVGETTSWIQRRSGFSGELETRVYPELLDVRSTFSSVEAHLRGFIPLDGGPPRPGGEEEGEHGEAAPGRPDPGFQPTLALRGGTRVLFGDYPFHSAAYLGGRMTQRALPLDRLAGDAMVYGSAELRGRLGRLFFLLPADWGMIGLVDVGRVFTDRDDAIESSEWHAAVGGGLWMQWVDFASTSFTVARGDEGTRAHFSIGMPF